MTDQPEKKGKGEEVKADFEAHRLSDVDVKADITDVKAANEDAEPDFEGHRLYGAEVKAVKA